MDLWVAAAAAGAGYLAKYWQNLSREREGLLESFSGDSVRGKSDLEQLRNKTCPFRGLDRRRLGEETREVVSSSSGGRFSETTRSGCSDASATEMASTSKFDGEMLANYGRHEDYNLLSLSSLPPAFSAKRKKLENEDRISGNTEVGDKSGDGLPELSMGELGACNRSRRNGTSLRSKRSHGYSVQPPSSLEKCLIAQLYKEHVEMDEYVFSSLPSPSTPTVRPLVVTDGNRIISTASRDSCSVRFESGESKLHKEDGFYLGGKETLLGVPPLPGPRELPRKPKQKRGKGRLGRLSSSNKIISGKQFQSQGSPNGMFLFYLGITVGVMSNVVSNKREVDKLNELLKQTENLVQDLEEELEMKDSLTVKELANEGYESHETNNPSSFNPARELDESLSCDVKRPNNQKSEGNSESLSKIEAELEAELKRLVLNMNASSVERRLSGLVELNSEFVVDIVQGEELRADMGNGGAGIQADSDRDTSGTSTAQTYNVNYAVSPRELSLRLHEVIQSRLEERIVELETALQNSQNRAHLMESKQMNFLTGSNGEIGYSSQESPTMIESSPVAQSLFLNLSGDALDAYDEAYEEFTRIARTDEENPPSMAYNSNQIDKEGLYPLDHSLFWSQNGGGENGSPSHLKWIVQRDSLVRSKIGTWEERILSQGSNEVCESDEDDEMEKLLIKQIVEKTRQGSPVVLNAQRKLFSMDENRPL